MNTPDLVGASAYVKKDYPNLFLPDRLWQIEPKESNISMRWLSYVLGSDKMRKVISSKATGTSNSMKNISKSSLLKIDISIPPFDEQKTIADVLSSVDFEVNRLSYYQRLIEKQKRGLMQKLLTGQWRVKTEE